MAAITNASSGTDRWPCVRRGRCWQVFAQNLRGLSDTCFAQVTVRFIVASWLYEMPVYLSTRAWRWLVYVFMCM